MRTAITLWRKRLIGLAAAWAAAFGLMSIAGMGPNPLLLAALIVVIVAGWWLVFDLGDDVRHATWRRRISRLGRGTASDARVSTIRMRMYGTGADSPATRRLYSSLVDLVDDRLRTEHGIDRNSDADAARAAMGDQLSAFVSGPIPEKVMASPRQLSSILTLIERL